MRKDIEITGKPAVLKELNIGLIKDALGRHGQATRVEIARMTGISQPTVNMLIKELTADGTVLNLGAAPSTGGRRAEVYTLNQKKFVIALVAVKSGFFEISVIDMELKEEWHDRIERGQEENCNAQLVRILHELIQKNEHIGAISVGVQGAVTNRGEVFAVPSVPEWEKYPLQAALEEQFLMPVKITNDINAVAAGYQSLHTQTENMIYLYTDGEGIGAGIILGKEVYSGSGSFAGELGYMQLGGHSVEELMCDKKRDLNALLGQIIINLICMYNPELIVLDSAENSAKTLDIVMQECRRFLPGDVIPRIDMAHTEEYYFRGLGKLGKELVDRNLHVV
ncbi:MAG: ROK family protein [Lachnospiraceae bacterium]|nr:ROK family protein [Lachnospiraceae bacterium]